MWSIVKGKLLKVKVGVFKLDKLSFELIIDVKKEYKNISKHKRELTQIVYSDINLFINELLLDKDVVFVVDEFFDSLTKEGEYPMFTCTCGIFECGGYNVDVFHKKDLIVWVTEEIPFQDKSIESSNRFTFSWDNTIDFAKQLAAKLNDLNNLRIENGYKASYNIEKYNCIIEKLVRTYL
ncbi:MAG TPA: hypothetical protein VF941_24620 [Clostridia bacterium]